MFQGGTSKGCLAALLALVLALGLAACGGSDDSSSSSTSSSGTERTQAEGDGGDSSQGGGEEAQPGGVPSGTPIKPDRSKPGAKGFEVAGGDNSIQRYGEEADESEKDEVEKVVVGFLDARAKRDWQTACGYLAESVTKPLETLASKSPKLKGADCATLLDKLQGPATAAQLANPIHDGLAAVRHKGENSFALFHGAEERDFYILLKQEGGEWKVASLAPAEFPY